MYKIRNLLPGPYAMQLEKGSITIMSGKSLDLDEFCSRDWIAIDPGLKRDLQKGTLLLVLDSEGAGVGKTNLAASPKKADTPKPAPKPEPKIETPPPGPPVIKQSFEQPKPKPAPEVEKVAAKEEKKVSPEPKEPAPLPFRVPKATPAPVEVKEPEEEAPVVSGLIEPVDDTKPSMYVENDLRQMRVTELKKIAKKHGIPTAGKSKSVVIKRILKAQ